MIVLIMNRKRVETFFRHQIGVMVILNLFHVAMDLTKKIDVCFGTSQVKRKRDSTNIF